MENFKNYFKLNEDIDREKEYQSYEAEELDDNKGSKTYYTYLKQIGEGCDYTIGCAQVMKIIKADSFDEAVEKLEIIIRENYYDDTKLEDAMIFECEPTYIDLDNLYTMRQKGVDVSNQQVQEEKDRAELKRLMNKYN